MAALLLTACQAQESPAPTVETVQLIFGDNPATKADVDGSSGVTTWTSGDQVAIYISGSGADAYQEKTVNESTGKVPISLTSGQSRANYAIYPSASAVSGHTTSADLRVTYPSTYDLSGMTVSAMGTYSPMPMVAVNSTGALTFYNVGGVLRLSIANVPSTAKQIRVTVPGMNIYGEYTVTDPSTTAPYVTTTSGSSASAVTLTLPTLTATTDLTLNLPLPAGDYSGVTDDKITVEALTAGGASTVASITGSVKRWSTISRRHGKKLSVDFGSATISITSSAATIWKGQTTTSAYSYTTTGSGVAWLISGSSSDSSEATSVATINSSTGLITGTAAGTAYVYATINGGAVVSSPVAVYVNAVTGITMSPSLKTIAPSSNVTLTATLTHTSNGTIASYPSVSVSWTSANTDYVTVSSASSTASYTDGSYKATMTINTGETKDTDNSYKVTASISGNSITSSDPVSADCAVLVSDPLPEFYNGFLFRNTNTATFKSATYVDATSDPLILLQYCGASNYYRMFFTWNELAAIAIEGGGSSTSTSFETASIITIGGNTYHIATKSEYQKLNSASRSNTITVGSTPHSNKKYSVVHVDWSNLTDEQKTAWGKYDTYNNKGYSATYDDTSANLITGILFYPDGITASTDASLTSFDENTYSIWATTGTNSLTPTQLSSLVSAGCIFLPAVGRYINDSWGDRGTNGRY